MPLNFAHPENQLGLKALHPTHDPYPPYPHETWLERKTHHPQMIFLSQPRPWPGLSGFGFHAGVGLGRCPGGPGLLRPVRSGHATAAAGVRGRRWELWIRGVLGGGLRS